MSGPPRAPAMQRRLSPRPHHLVGAFVLLLLLATSLGNPFRVQRTASFGTPRCRVELSYPARMVFSETERIEARISTSEVCHEPSLQVDSAYLARFRDVSVLSSSDEPRAPSPVAPRAGTAHRVRMELMAARSMVAEGELKVRCGEDLCGTFLVSTFVFP